MAGVRSVAILLRNGRMHRPDPSGTQIVRREDADDTRCAPRVIDVDRFDACMSVLRTHEPRMGGAGQLYVVDEPAGARQKRIILETQDRLANAQLSTGAGNIAHDLPLD